MPCDFRVKRSPCKGNNSKSLDCILMENLMEIFWHWRRRKKNISDLTLCRPMDHSIKFDNVKSRWSKLYTERTWGTISPKNIVHVFHSLKINFVLINSAEPDKMPPVAFYQGLHCLPKFAIYGYPTQLKFICKSHNI